MVDRHDDLTDVIESSNRIDLGPTATHLFRVFRLPVLCAVLSLGLMVIAGLVPGAQAGLWIGGVVLLLAAALAIMEIRDLRRPWIEWDDKALTLQQPGSQALRLPWGDIADMTLTEVVTSQRFHLRQRRLRLAVRPLQWSVFTRSHPHYADYVDSRLSDYSVGVPASEGKRRREMVDQRLRAAGVPAYVGVTHTQVTAGRWGSSDSLPSPRR
jgi:hypothetical protein